MVNKYGGEAALQSESLRGAERARLKEGDLPL